MGKQGFWDESLLELQRQYWQRWSEVSAAASGQPAAKSPWEMALAHWWQAIAPSAPASGREFMERMMDQGGQLFRMAEMFSSADGGQEHDWKGVLDDLAAQMKAAAGSGGSLGDSEQMQKLMGFWSVPLQGWQRMASDFPFAGEGAGDNPFSLERMLKVPGFGYTREEQAQQQKLAQLVSEYQQALQAYNRFFADIGGEAAKRLRSRLQQMDKAGEAIESGRALYDIWVASCESVYGERVGGGEFARINGELINSSMRVKQQMGRMADDYLGGMNMPTRRELRTLQQRLQENRRENKQLRHELELLKQRQQALEKPGKKVAPKKKANARSRVARPAGKKTVTKKRVAVKKPIE
jgi:class III poly(R)-hydroxyalkanoic acid synthase PhaE subunit